MKKIFSFFAALLVAGSMMADVTYKLTEVTEVSAGKSYVFERNSHVLIGAVTSKKLQTTGAYETENLDGTEAYIWKLEAAEGGFYLKQGESYLNNVSGKTDMSLGAQSSIWTIAFDGGVALISNKSNSNRYIGETGEGSNEYKAYATGNMNYGHDFKVYEVVEAAPTIAYYLVGTFNEWTPAKEYKFKVNTKTEGEYYLHYVKLPAGAELKAVGVLEGQDDVYFPGEANNLHVFDAGLYDIYFRPDYHGANDWYEHTLLLQKHEIPATCAAARESVLALDNNAFLFDGHEITLRGYVTEIVDEYNNEYHNITFWIADAIDGGQVIEAFRAVCATEADAPAVGDLVDVTGKLKKYYKAASGDAAEIITPEFDTACTFKIITDTPSALDNANVEYKAVKAMKNGQLIIIKNGVRYNALGTAIR